ncbi:preprotein translocase [Micrococcales bacterium 31B]|nr:preprotein translocase [Micrococcales bacterium 31B]
MRSRFEAYRRGDLDWIIATWHPRTLPSDVNLDNNPRWRALQIVDTVAGGEHDEFGIVEFRATYLCDAGHGVMHERSRFERVDGRWVYVDGGIFE